MLENIVNEKPDLQESKGFTLVEVLIAMIVGLIGLLGVGAMTMAMVNSIDESRKLSVATTLGQEKMGQIESVGYDNAIAATYPEEYYGTIQGNPQFRRTVTITDSVPEANMKTVTVTVSWIGINGTPRDVLIDLILTKEATG